MGTQAKYQPPSATVRRGVSCNLPLRASRIVQVLRVAVDNTGASEVELSAAMQQTEGSRSFSVEYALPPRPLDELSPVCSLRRVSR